MRSCLGAQTPSGPPRCPGGAPCSRAATGPVPTPVVVRRRGQQTRRRRILSWSWPGCGVPGRSGGQARRGARVLGLHCRARAEAGQMEVADIQRVLRAAVVQAYTFWSAGVVRRAAPPDHRPILRPAASWDRVAACGQMRLRSAGTREVERRSTRGQMRASGGGLRCRRL